MGITGKIHLRKKRTTLFRNCSELSLWNYMKAEFSDELHHLVRRGPVPSNDVLKAHLDKINEEFNILRGEHNTQMMRNDMLSYKEELELKCTFGTVLVDRLQHRIQQELIRDKVFNGLIAELKNWGFFINKDMPLGEVLQEVLADIAGYETTIKTLDGELYPEKDPNAPDVTDAELEFHSMLLKYRRILDIGKINPKKTSLKEFVVLEKQVKEAIKPKGQKPE